jgi:hypothetical protein
MSAMMSMLPRARLEPRSALGQTQAMRTQEICNAPRPLKMQRFFDAEVRCEIVSPTRSFEPRARRAGSQSRAETDGAVDRHLGARGDNVAGGNQAEVPGRTWRM